MKLPRTPTITQHKANDAAVLAKMLDMLPEGDKREAMGYIKCLYASSQRNLTVSTQRPAGSA